MSLPCALQSFRSCQISLSSKAIRRPSNFRRRLPTFGAITYGTRLYSNGTEETKSSEAEAKTERAGASKETSSEEIKETPSELLAKLKAKEAQVQDITSRLRYLQAEYLNFQRNAAREKEQTRDYAITRFAGDLLEMVDVLSMALKSVPPSLVTVQSAASQASPENPPSESSASDSPKPFPTPEDSPSKSAATNLAELHTGVDLTHRLLLQILFKYQVTAFDPTGEKFDPNKHEALYQAPIPGKEAGTVIDCQKVGYMIKDRVLRAAQVGVAQQTDS